MNYDIKLLIKIIVGTLMVWLLCMVSPRSRFRSYIKSTGLCSGYEVVYGFFQGDKDMERV